jgi:hypothetical protein
VTSLRFDLRQVMVCGWKAPNVNQRDFSRNAYRKLEVNICQSEVKRAQERSPRPMGNMICQDIGRIDVQMRDSLLVHVCEALGSVPIT